MIKPWRVFVFFMLTLGIAVNISSVENQSTPNSEVKEFSITASRFNYDPGIITVNKGDRVRFKLTAKDTIHGFALYSPGLYNINKMITPGKTVIVEFDANETGEYIFYCSNFCGSGHDRMMGKLIVREMGSLAYLENFSSNDTQELTLIIKDWSYNPSTIYLKQNVPAILKIINKDSVAHGFASYELNIQERIEPGETKVIYIPTGKSGIFHAHCIVDCGDRHFSISAKIDISPDNIVVKKTNSTNIGGTEISESNLDNIGSLLFITTIGGFILALFSFLCYMLYSKWSMEKGYN